jgi:mannose-1-phosphate guanylyltransferase
VVTPADHLVTNEVEFQRIIRVGMDFVEDPAHRDALLTIGIKPSRPETGYGYIEVSDPSAATAKAEVLPVVNFREKPDLETAKQYLAAGRYLWNAGIFVWSLQGIRNAYHDYLPAMEQLFDQGRSLFGSEKEQAFIDGMFAQCENISIDYGVMERSPNRFTIPADFGWSDIGTWGSLYEHAAHDAAQNAVSGHAVLEDTRCSVVNIEPGYEAVVQGMDRCLVALRDHSLLVCRLDDEQNIKHWIERL